MKGEENQNWLLGKHNLRTNFFAPEEIILWRKAFRYQFMEFTFRSQWIDSKWKFIDELLAVQSTQKDGKLLGNLICLRKGNEDRQAISLKIFPICDEEKASKLIFLISIRASNFEFAKINKFCQMQ